MDRRVPVAFGTVTVALPAVAESVLPLILIVFGAAVSIVLFTRVSVVVRATRVSVVPGSVRVPAALADALSVVIPEDEPANSRFPELIVCAAVQTCAVPSAASVLFAFGTV